ncbi:MAG: hypothetical protein KDC38_18500, partial [Planctomycetes bacterium]|nr:hypothetical protein [Planctomycetota bacterium]
MIRHRRVASNLLAPCLALLLRSSALTESPSEPLWVVDGARRAIVAPALGSGPTAEIATESGSLAFDHLLPIGTALERTAARPVGHGSLWVVDGLLIV